MKKILSIFTTVLFVAVLFSGISPALAQSNSSETQVKKSTVWNGWNKITSWFTKKNTTIKKENITKAKIDPVVIPAVVPKVISVTPKPKPVVKKTLRAPSAAVVSPVAAKTLSVPSVAVVPPVENKLVASMEDEQLKILQLDGTETDYSKSESSVANFFLTDDETKYLPDVSALLRAYPNMEIHSVNSKGDFAGCLAKNNWDNKRAFAKIKGKIYNIGLIEKGGFYACAVDINENGQVVGSHSFLDGMTKGFLWENGKISKLSFTPLSISGSGIVVGSNLMLENGVNKDLLIDGEKINKNYYSAEIQDINNNNQVLVSYYENKRIKKFLIWQDGKIFKVDDLIPRLGIGEFIVVDGTFADSPKFSVDGSLKLRVDRHDLITKIIDGEEHNTSALFRLRYYKISLPNDISAIKIHADNALETSNQNISAPVPANSL